jgi:histidinol-phosphatase (PHP family)
LFLSDFHTHPVFGDGNNTCREMIEAAAARGLAAYGISEHSHMDYCGDGWVMIPAGEREYKKEMRALQSEFSDRIELFVGVEQDITSGSPTDEYDYVIGSAHVITVGGKMLHSAVDSSKERASAVINECFGGDALSYAEKYFETAAAVAKVTKCDIVGHFDLVNKYNEADHLFSTADPRYQKAATDAMDELLKTCRVFEVNTGAMFRLGRTERYPQNWLLRYLKERGADVILSSDAHQADAICYKFAETEELLRQIGFKRRLTLTQNGFKTIDL